MDTTSPTVLIPQIFSGHAAIAAAFSTRQGGASPAPYASLNLGLNTGDEERYVRENRRRLVAALGFEDGQLALGGQVHGCRVQVVSTPGLHEATDGLVSTTPGLLLGITSADCAAVLLADPQAQVVAACHAGWRGTVAGIVPETLRLMQECGAAPERIYGYISPCISQENFEVGPEVAEKFDEPHVHHPPDAFRPFVDLKAVVAAQLQQASVLLQHVEISPHCTVGDTDTFFSHRAENGITGRMMGVIGLRS